MNYSFKNWKRYVIASSFLVAGLIGCDKEYSEQDFLNDQADLAAQNALLQDSLAKARMQDSLKTNGYLIDYTVKVVSANEASFSSGRTMDTHSGANAIITFTQGDSIASITANEQGFAFFENVNPGVATVNVELADHTPVSMNIEFLTPEALSMSGPFSKMDSSYAFSEKDSVWVPNPQRTDIIQYRHASTIIPVFNIADSLGTSVISGKAVYVSSVVNATRSAVPDGTRISASIDASDANFNTRYLDNYAGNHQSGGSVTDLNYQDYLSPRILKAVYEGTLSSTETTNGMYSLKVPTAVNGLPIRMQFSDFTATQEIALNKIKGEAVKNPRVESINTIFSSTVINASGRVAGDNVGQNIPTVTGAKVEIAAPPVSGSGATVSGTVVPRTLQTGEITLPVSGDYDLVVITNGGSGYTGGEDTDALTVSVSGSTSGVEAEAYARIEGNVDSIAIIKQSDSYVTWGSGTLEDAVSLTPSIENGTTPETGTITDVTTTLEYTGSVNNINPTYGGKGYTSVPNVVISGGNGSGATATAVVSGTVTEVDVSNAGSGYEWSSLSPSLPRVTVDAPTSGTPAQLEVNLTGAISDVTLSGGGSGYTDSRRPTVTIDNDYGSGAAIDFDIEGPVNNIFEEEEGEGYVFEGSNGSTFDNAATKPTITFDGFNINNDSAQVSVSRLYDAEATSFTLANAITGLTADTDYDIAILNSTNDEIGRFNATTDASGELATGTVFTGNISEDIANTTSLLVTGLIYADGTNNFVRSLLSSDISDVRMSGGLDLDLTTGGTYSQEPTITITDTNKTGTATALYRAYINGSITNLTLTSGGSGYRWGKIAPDASAPNNTENVTVDITIGDAENYDDYNGSKTNATLYFDLEGSVTEIVITDGGSGFTVEPVVTVEHPGTVTGTQATATSTIGYSVTGITITNVGSGYTEKPTVTIDAPTGSGLTRQAYIEADDIELQGEITAVNVDNSGYYALKSGSNSDNQGYIKLTGSVAGFEARAYLNGTVTGLYISQGGRDYIDTPTVTFSGGNGTGAAADWTIFGKQYAYTVNAGGSGYHVEPKILEDISAALPNTTAPSNTGVQDTTSVSTLYDHEGVFAVNAGSLVMAYNGVEMKTVGYYQAEPTIVIESKQTTAPVATANINADGEITGFDVTTDGEGYDKTTAPAITVTTVGPAESTAATLSWISSEFQKLGGTISSNTYTKVELMIEGGEGYRSNVNTLTSTEDFKIIGGNSSISSDGVVSITVEPSVDVVFDIDYGTGRREVEVE